MRRWRQLALALSLLALVPLPAAGEIAGTNGGTSRHTTLPEAVQQGTLVFGQTAPGSKVTLHGKALRVAPDAG